MKKFYALFLFGLFITSTYSQVSFETEFAAIKKELSNWDAVRGEWLANSIIALADKKPIPDRTFPEDYTPYQMLTMVPLEQRRGVSQVIEQSRNSRSELFANHWNMVDLIFNHSFCSTIIGRSYGDPHLRSFDQATYSFQTVGEFVVSKSNNNHFEIQARQSPQNKNFSLNTAIAMNVAGDRLCYYSGDKPDNNFSPWRLNGQPISLNGRAYFLPNGGTLSLNGRYYTISWPTGENVVLESRSGEIGFINITVEVFECDRGQLEGLLGNANGNMDDDFNGRSLNRQRPVYASFSSFGNPLLQQASVAAEREYLNFLSRDFAEDYRVSDMTTLFDYAIGTSTASFTDRSFPLEHYTVSDLPTDRRDQARKRCQELGVAADEMSGCIYDNGFLNINPNPVPIIQNPTRGVTLKKLDKAAMNNNFGTYYENLNLNPTPLPIGTNNNNLEKDPINKQPDFKTDEEKPNTIFSPKINQEIKSPKIESPSNKPNQNINTPNQNGPVQKPNLNGGGVKVKKG
jgi:hypothetical protein